MARAAGGAVTWPGSQEDWQAARNAALAVLAAALAVYVRARRDPAPLSFDRVKVILAEAMVCGFLSAGLMRLLEWQDVHVHAALAAALGLIGTAVIGDLLVALLRRRVDRG